MRQSFAFSPMSWFSLCKSFLRIETFLQVKLDQLNRILLICNYSQSTCPCTWTTFYLDPCSIKCESSLKSVHWKIHFLQLNIKLSFSSVQFSSVAQSCLTLYDHMNRSRPGLPVHHQLPESTQTQVHRVNDAIQPSHPIVSFSSCPQSFPASGSFPMSQLFA